MLFNLWSRPFHGDQKSINLRMFTQALGKPLLLGCIGMESRKGGTVGPPIAGWFTMETPQGLADPWWKIHLNPSWISGNQPGGIPIYG